MHIHDGDLHAYLDEQLSPDQRERVALHLNTCARCQAQADSILARARNVEKQLSVLEPASESRMQPAWAARAKLEKRLATPGKENDDMWSKLFNQRTRTAWITLGVIAVALSLFAFPAVRAAASDILGLFRVQQISVVEIDPTNLEQLDTSQFESFFEEEVKIEQLGDRQQVANAEEASAAAGFAVRLPPGADGAEKFYVQPGGKASMTVDLAKIQLLLDLAGRSDVQLPAEIDGAKVTVDVPTSVEVRRGNCSSGRCTTLMQVPSPSIDAPAGLNVPQIGQAFLQVLGMSREEAERFSGNIDWTTTLILPLPVGTEYREVQVDGVTGVLVMEQHRGTRFYGLMWVKDGIVYLLSGPGNASDAVNAASNMK